MSIVFLVAFYIKITFGTKVDAVINGAKLIIILQLFIFVQVTVCVIVLLQGETIGQLVSNELAPLLVPLITSLYALKIFVSFMEKHRVQQFATVVDNVVERFQELPDIDEVAIASNVVVCFTHVKLDDVPYIVDETLDDIPTVKVEPL